MAEKSHKTLAHVLWLRLCACWSVRTYSYRCVHPAPTSCQICHCSAAAAAAAHAALVAVDAAAAVVDQLELFQEAGESLGASPLEGGSGFQREQSRPHHRLCSTAKDTYTPGCL